MRRKLGTTLLVAWLLSLMSQVVAAQVFPSGQCTVIVASRINMAEVQDFMSINSQFSYDAVYEAENGWLAVSIGLLPVESAPEALAEMKSRGLITMDSYCSNGRKYVSIVWSSEAASNDAPPAQPPNGSAPTETSSAGTGFFIDADGHVMTNHHVIDGCKTITIATRNAKVISQSETFDLAILKVDDLDAPHAFLSFSDKPARLNSDVTVAGYPLQSMLGGLNITRGSISSMEGLWGDTATMQITAPIQPGNSGGPIVDQAGNVVGIVVSKLDAALVQEVVGTYRRTLTLGHAGR